MYYKSKKNKRQRFSKFILKRLEYFMIRAFKSSGDEFRLILKAFLYSGGAMGMLKILS